MLTQRIQEPTVIDVTSNKEASQSSPTAAPVVAGESTEDTTFVVTKVVDGDTIQLENGQKVRYIGIDSPETSGECFAKEATDKNKELVLNKEVQLVKDVSETDRYGRLLRYVYVNDIFVNNTLVREGFANAKTYRPDVKFQNQFARAEEEAKDQKKGLWGGCKN